MNPVLLAITDVTPTPALLQVWDCTSPAGRQGGFSQVSGRCANPAITREAAHTGWRELNRPLPRGAFPASEVSPTPSSFFFGGGGLVVKLSDSCDPMDRGGWQATVHGILQARMLE